MSSQSWLVDRVLRKAMNDLYDLEDERFLTAMDEALQRKKLTDHIKTGTMEQLRGFVPENLLFISNALASLSNTILRTKDEKGPDEQVFVSPELIISALSGVLTSISRIEHQALVAFDEVVRRKDEELEEARDALKSFQVKLNELCGEWGAMKKVADTNANERDFLISLLRDVQEEAKTKKKRRQGVRQLATKLQKSWPKGRHVEWSRVLEMLGEQPEE